MVFSKFPDVVFSDCKFLIKNLLIVLFGVNIGAPYSIIGLISESKSVEIALNESFERMTDLFSPKNALIALVFRSF